MRYQILSKPPVSTRSPNSPADQHTAQRSTATCSLSLTSVSASGKSGSIDSTSCSASGSDATAMLVDSCSVTMLSTTQPKPNVRVPFPKRPHSLLRSTTTPSSRLQQPLTGMSSVPFTSQETESDDEANVAQDLDDHPRKRTRTSAFSSNRIHLWRSEVTPGLDPSLSSHDTSALQLSAPRAAQPSPLRPPPKKLRPLASPSDPMLSSLPDAMILLGDLASQSHFFSPSSSSFNSFGRGKRATAGEIKHHLKLYRTLVHGLEGRSLSQPGAGRRSSGSYGALDSSSTRRGSRATRSTPRLEVQDALLAHRLLIYLLMNGANKQKLLLNNEDHAASENHEDGFLPSAAELVDRMDVDEESEVHPRSSVDDTQSPSRSRSPASPLSYQQLVATLIMRHFDPPRVPARRSTLARYPRARSALASGCITLDSY